MENILRENPVIPNEVQGISVELPTRQRSVHLPAWLDISWWIIYPISQILIIPQLYEETYVTWKEGPQNIGFGFAHEYGVLFLISAFSTILMLPWFLAAIVLIWRN